MALVDDKDVAKYEKRRYGAPDQKLVDRREQTMVDEIIRTLGLTQGRVLDAPCGYGRFSTLFARRGAEIICADVSTAMVGRARERVQEEGHRGLYVVMDIRRLPFKANTMEATFTMRLFHHGFAREQMGEILAELARVSRRWVILSYYRSNRLHGLFRRLKGFSSRIRMMTDAEFKAEAARAPLVIRSRRPVIPFLHAQTMVVLEKRKT
ncbi:MAG: class I SAM-dependent methyltransferase [Nitrospirae bacterium]|nr:class I SAM-dependent methyltransferase [Nitrospirota bacterium]